LEYFSINLKRDNIMTNDEIVTLLQEHEETIKILSIALEEAQRVAQKNAIELTKHFSDSLSPMVKRLIREELQTS